MIISIWNLLNGWQPKLQTTISDFYKSSTWLVSCIHSLWSNPCSCTVTASYWISDLGSFLLCCSNHSQLSQFLLICSSPSLCCLFILPHYYDFCITLAVFYLLWYLILEACFFLMLLKVFISMQTWFLRILKTDF